MAESDIHKKDAVGTAGDTDKSKSARRAGIDSFFAAFRHIHAATGAEAVKQRLSDYITIGLVAVCIMSLVAAVSLPVSPAFKLLPLLFTVAAVVFHIINRIGIILSLSSRQALIIWQILIAAFWLGVTSAMLVMMSCALFVSQTGH